MMWFLLIMAVAVALIIGPMMMMRPDATQKNKETMRKIASAKGIRFSIKHLPQQITETEKPAPIPVYFFPPPKKHLDEDWLLIRTTYEHEIHFLGFWMWQGEVRANIAEQQILKKYLPFFPDSVRAISMGSQGICVYWYEQGGEIVLEQVIGLLQALKKLQID